MKFRPSRKQISYTMIGVGSMFLLKSLWSWFKLKTPSYELILDAKSEEHLATIYPHVAKKVRAIAFKANAAGIKIAITDGYRSPEEQLKAVESGKSAAKVGWHQTKRAVDFVVLDPKTGKKNYQANDPAIKPLYEKVISFAEQEGFHALGYKVIEIKSGASAGKTFQDPYHIQYEEGLTKAEALKQAGVA